MIDKALVKYFLTLTIFLIFEPFASVPIAAICTDHLAFPCNKTIVELSYIKISIRPLQPSLSLFHTLHKKTNILPATFCHLFSVSMGKIILPFAIINQRLICFIYYLSSTVGFITFNASLVIWAIHIDEQSIWAIHTAIFKLSFEKWTVIKNNSSQTNRFMIFCFTIVESLSSFQANRLSL